MKIPQLQINQSIGRIGIKRQEGSFDIETSPPQINMDYGNPKPFQILSQPQIDNSPAELKIDNTSFLEDVEFRRFNSLVKHLRGLAKKKINQGIVEIAQEGNRLAEIENKGNKISQLAKKELTEDKQEIGLKAIPSSPPDIEVETNPVKVKVKPAKIRVETNLSFPEITATGDKFEIYLEQKGKLEIEVVDNRLDYHI
ncbi:DUF6470 family protein [Orenia marismortui]|uniref:Uncharacterized protein n=1 Tax=Orenia marismortui TaxID=46469 RepID=A0A4R8HHL6_9FIRM|nr:DUF6470 family protein [Orenia marismortui]TDX58898.1 hypothetical protein C7959_10236 [Orenia marismortui]